MNKINYFEKSQEIISEIKNGGNKPKLLLHSCCAPCSTTCIERLKDVFDLTVLYYNPNIDTKEEYLHRKEEQIRLCKELSVGIITLDHNKGDYIKEIAGLEGEPEGGKRCEACFNLRLKKTLEIAESKGFNYFATTLTLSPLKNSQLINEIGYDISNGSKVKYLPSDFKKQDGYLLSIKLSKKYDLYRQNYCGCEYSKKSVKS